MRRSALLLGAVVILLTGQSRSDSECVSGLARDDVIQNLEKHIIACNYQDNRAFLRSLPFGVNNLSVSLDRDRAQCFYLACCNKILRQLFSKIFLPDACDRINCDGATKIGAEIDGNWRCNADGEVISNETARCDTFETDGSGWNLVKANNNNTLCLKCESGSYLEDAGCKLCPEGRFSYTIGAVECQTCPEGHYSNVQGATKCEHCLQGYYNDVKEAAECKICPEGSYSDVEGATGCKNCSEGTYSDVERATGCKNCTEGTYSDVERATGCKNCTEGTYSDVERATGCKNCTEGTYSDVERATGCKNCTEGTYSDVERSTGCKNCTEGTYSDVERATGCKNCTEGTYSDVKRATGCKNCTEGTYSDVERATGCKNCTEGTYSDETGVNKCKPCPRGRYTAGGGASECLYCPAGHTTYTHTPNTCVGPQLEGLDRTKRHTVFSVRVSYDTLGNKERKAVFWKSVGDWNLLNRYKRKFARITQKYTTSYRRWPRVIKKSPVTTAVRQIIKDVYCYTGNGERYAGYENKAKSGNVCTGPSSSSGPSNHCITVNGEKVCYCRNKATGSHSKPYCEGQDGAEEDCDVPRCNDQERSGHQVTRCDYEKNTDVSLINSFSSSIGFADYDSARKVCDKLGGECKGVWGKGNSWRVTGLSPTEQGTGSYEFHRKDPHCPNPYHQYFFEQE